MGLTSSKQNIVHVGGKKPQKENKVEYFEPDFRVAWLIGIEHYENVKTIANTTPYLNVTQSKVDVENMKTLVNQLKFNHVITTIDACCLKEM